ncbi:glycosyltransferase family 4 protein [Paraclostridium tenue]
MKKVLILANHAITISLFRTELVEAMINEGYEVYISSPYGEQLEYFIELGCKLIETPVDRRGTNPKNDFKLLLKYNGILKDINPNVVLTYTVKPNLYGGIACRLNKVPYIPNVTGLGSGFINGGIIQRIVKQLSKISFKKAHKVMVQNSEDLNTLVANNLVRDDNYELIPGSGVNLNKYKVLDFPDKEDPIEFNFIGRVMKDKGIEEFLEAAKEIKSKYHEVKFNIIGMIDQNEYKEIIDKYQKEDIIRYYGFQKDTIKFIKNSTCTINPSYAEGMSNVLLESAACGRPIIASDIPGCREIINNNINGYTFEVKNTKDLTKKIEKIISLKYEERLKMGLAGRLKVENEFDRKIVVEKYINEMNKI